MDKLSARAVLSPHRAAGGVTHKDLLLENPVKLPFLGVDLPLKGFFALGPLIFLILHAYVLLHFVALTDKIDAYDNELRRQVRGTEARRGLRLLLPVNIFVQLLAGPRERRIGVTGALLRGITWSSLIIGPILLLLFFLLQFLAYHSEQVATLQRIALLLDSMLLVTLWPSLDLAARRARQGDSYKRWLTGRLVPTFTALVALPVALGLATFPGETLDQVGKQQRDPIDTLIVPRLWKMLVAGDVDPVSRRAKSLFANRLILQGAEVIDWANLEDAKLKLLPETLSLRGRDLRGAVLDGGILRKVDFTGANLRNASLVEAQLQGAIFRGADLVGADLTGAQMQAADFTQADMAGAILDNGALQAATLRQAKLPGASLLGARLQGADLTWADLTASTLYGATLMVATLDLARLGGASLERTDLQGATLAGTRLAGTILDGALLWRADTRLAIGDAASFAGASSAISYYSAQSTIQPWEASRYTALRTGLERDVPAGPRRDAALEAARLIDPRLNIADDQIMATLKTRLAAPPPVGFVGARSAAQNEAGCASRDAPYVLTGIARNLSREPLAHLHPMNPELAKRFLAPSCAGAKGLDTNLRVFFENAARETPAPP